MQTTAIKMNENYIKTNEHHVKASVNCVKTNAVYYSKLKLRSGERKPCYIDWNYKGTGASNWDLWKVISFHCKPAVYKH